MPRNLDLRIETLVPVEDPAGAARLDRLLDRLLDPETAAWELGADGAWRRGGGKIDVQEQLLAQAAREEPPPRP
jgi:polyphosphate kinase